MVANKWLVSPIKIISKTSFIIHKYSRDSRHKCGLDVAKQKNDRAYQTERPGIAGSVGITVYWQLGGRIMETPSPNTIGRSLIQQHTALMLVPLVRTDGQHLASRLIQDLSPAHKPSQCQCAQWVSELFNHDTSLWLLLLQGNLCASLTAAVSLSDQSDQSGPRKVLGTCAG